MENMVSLVRDVRWLLFEEKLLLVLRLPPPPPLTLTRARLEGITARESGGGGGGTRDGYEYILKTHAQINTFLESSNPSSDVQTKAIHE